MSRKNSYLTITDQFCGAGGSSQGARQLAQEVGGIEVKLALNHWKLAIETHSANFTDTLHDCTDISACDPRRYPSTDILLTSPECTNHSLAKGKKIVRAQMELYNSGKLDPSAERSRATMWDVPRFAEYHNYNIIIVENVVDARKWVMFDAWLMAMHALGYMHKCVYINSMHCHPTPQSRDRMYVVFWKKGNKAPQLDFTPKAYCTTCTTDIASVQTWKRSDIRFGKYRQQYIYSCPQCAKPVEPYYYAAYNCIDWSNIGTRIGDRQKPLSENTIKRIEYGLKKYGTHPFVVATRYTSGVDCRVKPITEEMQTQPSDVSHGVAMPFIVKNYGGAFHPKHSRVDITDPVGTITTSDHHALAMPFIVSKPYGHKNEMKASGIHEELYTQPTDSRHALAIPFIIKEEHSQNLENAIAVNESLRTQTTRQTMALCVPWIIEMNRTGEMKPASEATATMTSGGINHALAMHKLIGYYYKQHQSSTPEQPLGTCKTHDTHFALQFSDRKPKMEDVYYRMLKSSEVGRAMAFEDEYIVLGTERDRVKQYGNAVTPPVMKWILKQAIASLS